VQRELERYGRFDSYMELLTRVPDVAKADHWALEQLREHLEYGRGGLSVNTASASELDRAGFSRRVANNVVAFRAQYGSFESLDELDAVRGIGKATVRKAVERGFTYRTQIAIVKTPAMVSIYKNAWRSGSGSRKDRSRLKTRVRRPLPSSWWAKPRI